MEKESWMKMSIYPIKNGDILASHVYFSGWYHWNAAVWNPSIRDLAGRCSDAISWWRILAPSELKLGRPIWNAMKKYKCIPLISPNLYTCKCLEFSMTETVPQNEILWDSWKQPSISLGNAHHWPHPEASNQVSNTPAWRGTRGLKNIYG